MVQSDFIIASIQALSPSEKVKSTLVSDATDVLKNILKKYYVLNF